jgi:methyl-accepting chemotaxis protein
MLQNFKTWITGSLRRSISLLILITTILLLALFTFYDINTQKQTLEESLLNKGISMAMSGAAATRHILEDAISSGRLTRAEVFDTQYVPIADTDPQKFNTAYDNFSDANFQAIEDGYLLDHDVLFAAAVDFNGYLPTHNTKYAQPLTGNYDQDVIGNRTKRIFNDPTGITAAQNTQPYLRQVYRRDTGEMAWDISAPIIVNGSHWGAFRVAFSLVSINADVAAATRRILTAALILAGMIAAASFLVTRPLIHVEAMSRTAVALSKGDTSQDVNLRRNDEVGRLADAFRSMIAYNKGMAAAADRLAQGDFMAEVSPQSEKDALGNAFAQMITHLRDLVGQVAKNALHLSEAAKRLAITSDQAGRTTTQMAESVQQIAAGLSQQSDSVNKTASSAEQMEHAIEGIARGAQEQANAINQASAITNQIHISVQKVATNAQAGAATTTQAVENAHNGARTLEATISGIQSIQEKVGLSAAKIQEMGQRSEQIGAIIETISDIASQTNLLALNAAIEAARAGEQGKGFAVVADEVRKLAERSSNATKEIGNLIRGIQKSVAEAMKAMDEEAKEVDEGVERASQSDEALTEILKAIESVREQVGEIAATAQQISASTNQLVSSVESVSSVVEENSAAAEQMAAGSNEVIRAVEDIASVSEENSAAVEELSAGAKEMSAQVDEVNTAAQALSAMAEGLQQMVDRFKLAE